METRGHFSCAKPEGGFVLISVEQLCGAWAAYASGRIRLFDLRVWFASWEMSARRCMLGTKRTARFSSDELHQIVGGVSGRHLQAALRRLERAALMRCSESSIEFPVTPAEDPATAAMLQQIANRRRKVPVPRRMLRFLARGAGRVLIATVLGHMLRCLYIRNRECHPVGTCKASWTARVFGVDARNVKAARKQLAKIGWLVTSTAPQWRLNRYGAPVSINLAWGGTTGRESTEATRADSPPPQPQIATGSPPPESDKHLLTEYKNQKPASGRPDGVCGTKAEAFRKPDWTRLQPDDLRCPRRLGILYREAVARRVLPKTEATRLAFVAAAEHAQRMARSNACGLFWTVVTKGLWQFISHEAEDAARTRLRSIDEARRSRTPQVSAPTTPVAGGGHSLRDAVQRVLDSLHVPSMVDSPIKALQGSSSPPIWPKHA